MWRPLSRVGVAATSPLAVGAATVGPCAQVALQRTVRRAAHSQRQQQRRTQPQHKKQTTSTPASSPSVAAAATAPIANAAAPATTAVAPDTPAQAAVASTPTPADATLTASSSSTIPSLRSIPPPVSRVTRVGGPTATELSPVWSWGYGHLAGLGQGDYAARDSPTPINTLRGVDITDISSSWGRNIAITSGGSVIHWGWKPVMRSWLAVMKYWRRLPRVVAFVQRLNWGRGTLNGALPLLPMRLEGWGIEPSDPPLEPGQEPMRALAVSAGSDWCAILSDEGQVYTWGAGYYGQLGHSSHIRSTLISEPRMVCNYQNQHPNESNGRNIESQQDLSPSFPNSPIVQVATGFSHMLMLTRNGQVYACGKTDTGALGITHIYRDGKRLFLPHLIPVTDAFAAGEHGSGEQWIKATGVDSEEAQATQFLSAQNDPAIVEHYVGPMVQVATGMKHSLFLNSAGEVYACGSNGLNELGNDTYHPVHGLIRVKLPLSQAAGRRRRRGEGAEDTNDNFFSNSAMASEKIVKIVSGMHHSLALSNFGDVYAWGSNLQGQCGVPCSVKQSSLWIGSTVTLKKMGNIGSAPNPDEEAADSTVRPTSATSLRTAVNTDRRDAITGQCVSPTRIRLQQFDLGMPHSRIGRVVDIQAGFYDSVLITDAGHCITFGGGNLPTGQHVPHVFTLRQPTPAENTLKDDAPAAAVTAPYRVSKIAFGLGHALALVKEKKAQ